MVSPACTPPELWELVYKPQGYKLSRIFITNLGCVCCKIVLCKQALLLLSCAHTCSTWCRPRRVATDMSWLAAAC